MVVVGDHPQYRLLDVPASQGRLGPVRAGHHRDRHQGHRRDARVDQWDRDGADAKHPLQVPWLELEIGARSLAASIPAYAIVAITSE